jgi:two-component system, OmpR family, sensor histidine kinase CiaH
MFKQARFKLTFWYSLIIMLVSMSFSVVIYNIANSELNRFAEMQQLRIQRRLPHDFPPPDIVIDIDLLVETRNRLIIFLAGINGVILILSSSMGYMLAGRTLSPIKTMVDDQKDFVANSSHELRTPLTALMTETEVALRDKEITLQEAKDLLKSNLEEVNKMHDLANYLLTLNKYEGELQSNQFTLINLKQVVQKAIKKVQPQAKQKQIKLQSKLANINIKGNDEALIQLVVILLDNAIKYSPKNSKVILAVKKYNYRPSLTIQDFGIGITKADLPHIFDRFYRADISRSKKIDGFGLGLSIAKRIADLHHARIEVKSIVSKGSTFTVNF